MGSKSRRFSASEIVDFELGYMVWLVILLLGFMIHPADYGNMFQYADPVASLLEQWSEMIVNDGSFGNTTGHLYYLELEEREVIAMSQFAINNFYQQIENHSSKAVRRRPLIDLNPMDFFDRSFFIDDSMLLVGANPLNGSHALLSKPFDSALSENSDGEFSYAYFESASELFRAFPGREGGVCSEYDPQRRPWFVASDMKQIEVVIDNKNSMGTSTESALNLASNVIYLDSVQEIRLEFDKVGTPKEDLVSYLLIATSVQEEELRFLHTLSYNSSVHLLCSQVEDANDNSISSIIQLHGKIKNNSSVRHIQQFVCCGDCAAPSNNMRTSLNKSLELRTKVGSVMFCSIIIFVIILIMAWKRIKNVTLFKSNNGLDASILDESGLDESYHSDQILYDNLLKEAILVSEGSSGKVYKVIFLDLECAMKVFHSNARMDFRKESITLTNLSHPQIVSFFCCFRKSFILMELMDEDLYTFINKIRERHINYDMPLEVAVDVMLQIAEGMSYLHNQGIAHQDLKSLNILLKLRGEFHDPNFQIIAKVADFGSARSFDPRYPRGFVLLSNMNIGTRLWRAPELFHSERGFLTRFFGMYPRIMPKPLDIYGFAIICSELITKQIPFSNDKDLRVVVLATKIRDGHRPALPSDGCPEGLIALIMDCWHTDPRLRPEFNEICERLIEVKSTF